MRLYAARFLFAVALVLTVVTSAGGQSAPTYDMAWAEMTVYTGSSLASGSRVVELVPLSTGPDGPAWVISDATTHEDLWAVWTDGRIHSTQGYVAGTLFFYTPMSNPDDPEGAFFLHAEGDGHSQIWSVGSAYKRATP